MESSLLETIVVPLLRESSVKGAAVSAESTAGSASPKNQLPSHCSSLFKDCTFDAHTAFLKSDVVVTRLLPTKLKEVVTPADLHRRLIKEKFEAKIRAMKRPPLRVVKKPLAHCDKTFRYTIYQNNRLNQGSGFGLVIPMFMTEETVTKW